MKYNTSRLVQLKALQIYLRDLKVCICTEFHLFLMSSSRNNLRKPRKSASRGLILGGELLQRPIRPLELVSSEQMYYSFALHHFIIFVRYHTHPYLMGQHSKFNEKISSISSALVQIERLGETVENNKQEIVSCNKKHI